MNEEIINPKTVGKDDVTCFYHNDMDGIASASIVKKVYPNAKFIKVGYGDVPLKADVKDKTVIIVDFSFRPNIMELIHEDCSLLCWIDHHQSAMDKNEEMWDSQDIDGLRDVNKAGCELTWEWFFPHETIPFVLTCIADRDMWRNREDQRNAAFHEVVSIKFNKPNTKLVDMTFNEAKELCVRGFFILDKKKQQIHQSYEEGFDSTMNGHKIRVINSNHNVSDIGEYCYKENNYPIALIWSFRNGECICSLRSNTVDVGKIAELYGGGGHKFASGFKSSLKFIKGLYEDK